MIRGDAASPVLPDDLEPARRADRARQGALESLDLKTLERETIVRALAHWRGNRTRAAESLGISVRTLRNKIRDYGLR
jgi:DNA-binding NtrC family response regulator